MAWVDFWEMLDGVTWAKRLEAGVREPRHYTPEQAANDKKALLEQAARAGMV